MMKSSTTLAALLLLASLVGIHVWLNRRIMILTKDEKGKAIDSLGTQMDPEAGRLLSTPFNESLTDKSRAGTMLQCIDLVKRCNQFEKINDEEVFDRVSSASVSNTLALGDPFLRGGFRNQHIRLASLIAKAWGKNYTELLYPSLKFYGTGSTKGSSVVPFDMLYDVNHWNAQIDKGAYLPRLVSFDSREHSQWNPKTTLFRGFCDVIDRYAFQPGIVDFYGPRINSAREPFAYGGGKAGGLLWREYRRYYDKYGVIRLANQTNKPLLDLERDLSNALRPSKTMQALIDRIETKDKQPYVALHARVEPEMLVHHKCNHIKVTDLGSILAQIGKHPDFADLKTMFIAIAVPQMFGKNPYRRMVFEHTQNVVALKSALEDGIAKEGGGRMPVWTAGESAVESFVHPCMSQLISSFVNFEVAVSAAIFVGTEISSWSLSVWKERNYRGLPNYKFTREGIEKLEGQPPKFDC